MSLQSGIEVIRAQAKVLPDTPGVYRMLGGDGEVLYVGKARALRRRVMSYTQPERSSVRIMRMVSQTVSMEIVHTHTEVEALLLEARLIKSLKPKYNILLRDDKSFPYIHLTGGHDFPRVDKHRGQQKDKGDYFGPFASAGAVNDTIELLQKVFLLRNCSDSMFETRTRPCLQYHIKRCTAPCVGYVNKEEYAEQVAGARDFLEGKSREVIAHFAQLMQGASDRQDYEQAAKYRDKVRALSHVQLQQNVDIDTLGDVDVFALERDGGLCCVQVFFFRHGQNYGNKAYFPRAAVDEADSDVLGAFITQFYMNRGVPREIWASGDVAEAELIEDALAQSYKPKIMVPKRGDRVRVMEFARENAKQALMRYRIERSGDMAGLQRMAEVFDLAEVPSRIEVYDNSHIQGAHKVGAFIVAGPDGFRKNAYRKFNIKSTEAGDDFQMMREVMERRFARLVRDEAEEWPDVLLIDGGEGQLSSVLGVLDEMGVSGRVQVIAISKGPDRHAGREWFHRRGYAPMQLPPDDVGLMYMQRIRDEVHRFVIGAHRAKRGKAMVASVLDGIAGVGAVRKKALLQHFGSGKAVENAGLADLEAVPGISRAVARLIYDHFHEA